MASVVLEFECACGWGRACPHPQRRVQLLDVTVRPAPAHRALQLDLIENSKHFVWSECPHESIEESNGRMPRMTLNKCSTLAQPLPVSRTCNTVKPSSSKQSKAAL
eukprot:1129431-Pleurochrysis_carterae.AAC.1